MLVNVLPKSVVLTKYGRKSSNQWCSNATYAVPAAVREGSIHAISANFGTPGALPVRLVQCLPPSCVICRLPSSVPAQITPACAGDSAMRITVQWYSAVVFSVQMVPTLFCFSGSLVERSGLIAFHVLPKSVDLKTTLLPK